MGNITLEQILYFAGVATALITAKEIIGKYLFGTSKDRIKSNTKSFFELKEENECRKREIKEVKDNLKELQSTSQITLESLLALINHEIDRNGKEAMKNVRNKLQKQLIDK